MTMEQKQEQEVGQMMLRAWVEKVGTWNQSVSEVEDQLVQLLVPRLCAEEKNGIFEFLGKIIVTLS